MDPAEIERAASLIRVARTGRTPLGPLPEACRPTSEPEAYAVQAALNRQLTAAGAGPTGGHKIGCTTPVMQAYLNIPNPCAGEVFAATIRHGRGRFAAADHLRPGVECEIAVRLGADLVDGPFSRERVGGAVAAVLASIEVVDDRYVDYPTLGTPTLVADDFFNAGLVLGPAVAAWQRLDLAGLAGRMLINGREVGTGRGGDILGHPFEALAWLASNALERGRPLRAGEYVTLGSVVATKWVEPGDEVRVEVEVLGEASAIFAG
jgi:2-oxo-3-hexenedioate decarboxylase/2-keto-4-pentenoate hydratase